MSEESGDVPQRLIDVGASIRNLRKSQGMTQTQLSEATEQFGDHTGVSWTTIRELENPKKSWQPRESTLGDLSEALGKERSCLSEIHKGLKPRVEPSKPKPKPKAGRKAEYYLEEISKWMSAVDQHLERIDKRLDSIDTTLGLASRPDIGHHATADPPETES